jgi:cyclic pyranopterin phosphate synthase
MANILFTRQCVRNCPYCFANKYLSISKKNSSAEETLSWENLIYLADFLSSAGEKRFGVLGGEPTLHPEFNSMVLYLLERNFDVTVFTSGIMKEETLKEAVFLFRELDTKKISFVCNLNNPNETNTPLSELESTKRFLQAFGDHIVPGYNIYKKDFDLTFILEYINEYGLQRNIRIGLTHPIPGSKNKFIRLNEIDDVIKRLFSFRPLFESFKVQPGLDCGFPACKFNDEQLGWLYRNCENKYDFGCGPVIDIGPDMNIWPCFPLSQFHARSIFDFNTFQEVLEYYHDLHKSIRIEEGGIFIECDTCELRIKNICKGGCVAHSLSRFQNEIPVRAKEVYY